MRALLVAALVLTACRDGSGDGATSPDRLPALTLAALDARGQPLALADLHGPAVVNLWATWCQPCLEELPAFQQVADARPDVRFIGVNTSERGDARTFLDELGVRYEQYVDARGELAEALGAAGLPVTVVVDADGDLATQRLGPMDVDDLGEALAAVTD